jgi:hypothetical protein
MLATALCCLPMCCAMLLASLAYTANIRMDTHNILWSPRFSFVFGIACSGLFFSLLRWKSTKDRLAAWCCYALFLGAWGMLLQFYLLEMIRGYSVVERVGTVVNKELTRSRFTVRELAMMECLNSTIQLGTPIFPANSLWSAFHSHNIDPWNKTNPYRSYPEIRICDTRNRLAYEGNCLAVTAGEKQDRHLRKRPYEGLELHFLKRHQPTIKKCVSQLK